MTLGTLRDELQNGIRDLEQFTNHIDAFVKWWTWMKMEESAKEDSTQGIQFNYDSLRLSGIIRKWRKLKMQYATYADEVRIWYHRTSCAYVPIYRFVA
jgi:hypothetical protein